MKESEYVNGMGKRLEELRFERDLSCYDAAKGMGVDPKYIYRYESGIINPRIPNLIAIAQFYKVSADYIFGLSKNKLANNDKSEFNEFANEISRLSNTQKKILLEFLKSMK